MKRNLTGEIDLSTAHTIKSVMDPIKSKWRKLWKNEEAKFRLFTALKMTMVPIFSFSVMGGCMWILLNMNLLFFRANEIRGIDRFEEVFFDFLSSTLIDILPYAALLLIFVNVTAIYISDILLRPFRTIGQYCELRNRGENSSYNPDFFTDLKLLSQFGEFFFNSIETAEANKSLLKIVIPKKYTRIHKPVFETAFFGHYLLYLLASLLAVSIALYTFANEIYQNIINLAEMTLPSDQKINLFLGDQVAIMDSILVIVIVVTFFLYLYLARNLYDLVARPAFGVFSTMRSFLKGNYGQRVHLIGYPFLRDQTRSLNKYLDWVEKNLVEKSETKG